MNYIKTYLVDSKTMIWHDHSTFQI